MASEINVEVVSPSRPVARVKANRISFPGAYGYMDILPHHAALISEIDVGRLTVDKVEAGDDLHYFVSGGYVEVKDDKVTILADVIESPRDIDRARAEAAKRRALECLEKKDPTLDVARAQEALRRAHHRLEFLDALVGTANLK